MSGLPKDPIQVRPFDPVTLQFTTTGAISVTNGTFSTTLPALGTRVYQVYFPSGCGLVGLEPLALLWGALRLRRWRRRRAIV